MSELTKGLFLATVTAADPSTQSVSVELHGQDHSIENIPLMTLTQDPDMQGGSVFLPKAGATCVINTNVPDGMLPFCMGFLRGGHEKKPTAADTARATVESLQTKNPEQGTAELMAGSSTRVLPGSKPAAEDTVNSMGFGDSYAARNPGENYPGDLLLTGSDGNSIGVLESGVTLFKASDLAQMLGFKYGDLLRIVARNFELLTEFGDLKISSNGGRSSMKLTANPNVFSAQEGNVTIEFSLGEQGKILRFVIKDSEDPEVALFMLEIDSAGNVSIDAAGDIKIDRNTRVDAEPIAPVV